MHCETTGFSASIFRRVLASLITASLMLLASGLSAASAADPSDYAVHLAATRIAAVAGQETVIDMTLDPPVPPAGYFITSLLSVRTAPDGPAPSILPGFPTARIIPAVPGRYVLDLRVNMITKSSCGGVEASTLLETTLTLDAAPSR